MLNLLGVIIACISFLALAANPSIYLDSPNNGAAFLLQKGGNSQPVPLEYQLFGLDNTDRYELCFELFSVTEGLKKVIDVTCVSSEHNRLTMNDLKEGQYQLHGWLKSLNHGIDLTQSTKIMNMFYIHSYASAAPKIELHPQQGLTITEKGQFNIVANAQKGVADISLAYSYTSSLLDHSFFVLCAYILDLNTAQKKVKLPLTCLGPNDRQLILNNLAVGEFLELHLLLRDTRYNDGEQSLLKSSEVVKVIQIMDLSKSLPKLVIQDPHQEYMEHPDTHTATVHVNFQLEGEISAIKQVVACITIDRKDEPGKNIVPFSCLPPNNNVVTLQNMKRGEYYATMVLSRIDKPNEYKFSQTTKDFTISIRPPVELVPTYDWQPLHAWHTIPSGIETR
jgi:hypothetical protein